MSSLPFEKKGRKYEESTWGELRIFQFPGPFYKEKGIIWRLAPLFALLRSRVTYFFIFPTYVHLFFIYFTFISTYFFIFTTYFFIVPDCGFIERGEGACKIWNHFLGSRAKNFSKSPGHFFHIFHHISSHSHIFPVFRHISPTYSQIFFHIFQYSFIFLHNFHIFLHNSRIFLHYFPLISTYRLYPEKMFKIFVLSEAGGVRNSRF